MTDTSVQADLRERGAASSSANGAITNGDEKPLLTAITSLIARSGREAEVARDFEQAFARAGRNSHHLATTLVQQNGLNFLISQFRSKDDLRCWQASAAYREMIAAFEKHSVRELCTIEEPVARIRVPSDDSGPRWKVLVSTWIVTYPMLLVIALPLDGLAPDLHWALRLALSSLLVSIALIWVISPMSRRMTRTWRLKNQQMRIDVIRYPNRA